MMWIATFRPLTAVLHQAMASTGHVSLYVAPWLFVIGALRSSWYRSAFVLFDRGHPHFWNFKSVNPIYVIRMKSYVDGLFNPSGVPM